MCKNGGRKGGFIENTTNGGVGGIGWGDAKSFDVELRLLIPTHISYLL